MRATSLMRDFAMALDPVQLARGAGIDPDDWQSRLLRSGHPRILLNCSRQTGKSTIAAVLAQHTAYYDDGAPILLLSPSLRQSPQIFRKCLDVYRALDKPVPTATSRALRVVA